MFDGFIYRLLDTIINTCEKTREWLKNRSLPKPCRSAKEWAKDFEKHKSGRINNTILTLIQIYKYVQQYIQGDTYNVKCIRSPKEVKVKL